MKKQPLFDVSHFNRIADKFNVPWIDRIPLIESVCWGSKGWIDADLSRKTGGRWNDTAHAAIRRFKVWRLCPTFGSVSPASVFRPKTGTDQAQLARMGAFKGNAVFTGPVAVRNNMPVQAAANPCPCCPGPALFLPSPDVAPCPPLLPAVLLCRVALPVLLCPCLPLPVLLCPCCSARLLCPVVKSVDGEQPTCQPFQVELCRLHRRCRHVA